MSQRLLISLKQNVSESDGYYDCIYTEEGTLQKLLDEWVGYEPELHTYHGPWKIIIRDHDIMDQFFQDFQKIKEFCPELETFQDCWSVYDERLDKKLYNNDSITKFWFGAIEKIIDSQS